MPLMIMPRDTSVQGSCLPDRCSFSGLELLKFICLPTCVIELDHARKNNLTRLMETSCKPKENTSLGRQNSVFLEDSAGIMH